MPLWNLFGMKLADRTSLTAVLWQLKQWWGSGWTEKFPKSPSRCFSRSQRRSEPNHVRCRDTDGPRINSTFIPTGANSSFYFAAVQIYYTKPVNINQLLGKTTKSRKGSVFKRKDYNSSLFSCPCFSPFFSLLFSHFSPFHPFCFWSVWVNEHHQQQSPPSPASLSWTYCISLGL